MRIDTPVIINQVTQRASWLFGPFSQVWDGIHDLMSDRSAPSFLELAILVVLGIFCGFMVMAYSFEAILVIVVMMVGTTWGMVLGLLIDRLFQSSL